MSEWIDVNKDLDKIKEYFPDAFMVETENRATRLHVFGNTYVSQNEFNKVYFLFIDSHRVFSKDFNKILKVLKAIKDVSDKSKEI